MKIISKYKDYYDYLVGIYEIDEKLVLDRTKFDVPSYSNVVTFYICGKCIDGYYDAKDEGFVVRNFESFHYDDFSTNVGKWVRPKHVTTDQHWMFSQIVPNKLKKA